VRRGHTADLDVDAPVAGDGWSMLDVPVQSYQLVFPDKTAIIDTALDKSLGCLTRHRHEMPVRWIEPPCDRADLVIDILHTGDRVRFQASGISMQPWIQDGDLLEIAPAKTLKVRRGDVVLSHSAPFDH
jgi:hypothetical protein